jgi:hypothetical protein
MAYHHGEPRAPQQRKDLMMTTQRLVLFLLLCLLGTPLMAWTIDAETAALEAYALCHAQPYRCPPEALMTPEERAQHDQCESLTPHLALIASKRAHHETLDAADLAAEQTWQASCRNWEKIRTLRTPQKSPNPAAFSVPAPPRITTDCWTDAWWGYSHSSISTSCTSTGR